MTKTALRITAQLQSSLLSNGRLVSPLLPPARDGYAAMAVWIEGGMPVERLRLSDIQPIPDTLRLDTARLRRCGVGYELIDRQDWIVLTRIKARDTVEVAPRVGYAYPDPMLVYCGWRGERRSIITGCVNLRDTPTIVGLRLSAGKNFAELGSMDLNQSDADSDLLAVAQCLARFYGVAR